MGCLARVAIGDRFMFNSYKHWSTLVIRQNDDSGEFLISRQGVTQGDSLVMLGYALGMLSLTRQLKAKFPEVDQHWYADNVAAAAAFVRIHAMFESLLEVDPGSGYQPESSK
jgi:hypothetical protein